MNLIELIQKTRGLSQVHIRAILAGVEQANPKSLEDLTMAWQVAFTTAMMEQELNHSSFRD